MIIVIVKPAKYGTRKNSAQAKQATQSARRARHVKTQGSVPLTDTARAIGLPLSRVSA